MRSSCIPHPENEPLVQVRKWQVEACDGNFCAAALLSFFEYWHNIKSAMSERNQRIVEAGKRYGEEVDLDTSDLHYHSEEDIEEGLIGMYKRKTIRLGVNFLVEKGFVSVHRNPNPHYAFDNTKFFRLEVEAIKAWLQKRTPQPMKSLIAPKPRSKGKITSRSGKNAGTITEITKNLLYSGASTLNETTREEEENEASPVCTTGRSASCAVKGGEENGHTLVAPLSNKTKEAVFTPPQVVPVTTTINASLSEETVKRREVRRLKSALKLLELPRNIQGYAKQCTIDQLTYVIETAIDKSDSFQGEALIRYTVGIFKNTLDPNPEARKPKHKRLTSKQLGRMSSAHYKHKDKYQDDPKRDESKIYPPIRIKIDGKIIECVLCGYQHDPEWGIETLSYHTYREQEGRVTRGYEYHSVEVPNVEIFRSVYPNGFVKGDW